jgi:hypothetical protein
MVKCHNKTGEFYEKLKKKALVEKLVFSRIATAPLYHITSCYNYLKVLGCYGTSLLQKGSHPIF